MADERIERLPGEADPDQPLPGGKVWRRLRRLLFGEIAREYPRVTFFGGKVVFRRESRFQRLLHNETALALQNRLFWAGKAMVILPARVP